MLKPQHFDKIFFIWEINDQKHANAQTSLIRGIELEYRSLQKEVNNEEKFWISLPYLLSPDIDDLILFELVLFLNIFFINFFFY